MVEKLGAHCTYDESGGERQCGVFWEADEGVRLCRVGVLVANATGHIPAQARGNQARSGRMKGGAYPTLGRRVRGNQRVEIQSESRLDKSCTSGGESN